MNEGLTRRRFLGTAGVAATAALLTEPLFDLGIAEAAVPLVRRDVGRMDGTDPILLAYRRAIAAMQALPNTNPLSWAYQAAIHWTTLPGMMTAWDSCEHGTDFFWSWHRMYLYWFERIIRKMSGEPCWALPYWDWAPGTQFQLPAPFREASSELYTVNRDPNINSGAGSLNPGAVSVTGAFSSTNFLTANNIIQGPHGSVHVEVGGWMRDVSTAAQDPIFYLHHSNVDRLWNLWLAQGAGRGDPLANSAWRTKQYTFFDENGSQVTMSACQILRAAQQLNYVYECEPSQIKPVCRFIPPIWEYLTQVVSAIAIPRIELKSEPVSFPIELRELRTRLEARLKNQDETVFLELAEVEADNQPGAVWEVYAGLAKAGAQPDYRSPSYIGSLSLFGSGIRSETHGEHKEFKAARFLYPLNRVLATALKSNAPAISITFVPVGILLDGKPTHPEIKSPVRIGKVNLIVETRKELMKKPDDLPE